MLDRTRLTLRRTTLAWRKAKAIVSRRPEVPAAPAPFLKWVGGKSKLLGALTARAPRDYRRYFEPFLGGGALFFRLAPAAAQLSDTNADLIACYTAVRDDVDGVMKSLARHRARHEEPYYYRVRERWNGERTEMNAADRAAAFLYLNKTCYNGLWRVNRRGDFNVPAGRYENPAILDASALQAANRALRGADLSCAPFERVLDEAGAGDLVYFDPPYDPISTTANFTSYTANAFTADDQARLAGVYRTLADRGCAVMLSNSDTPLVRKLYAGFRVDRVFCTRAINSKADARGAVAEVIVTNRY